MSQHDKSKNATSRKGTTKIPTKDLDSRIAELMEARDAAQKQAIDRHAELQALSRRTGELEIQIGELDERNRKSVEDGGQSDARAVAAAKEAAAALEQLAQANRALAAARNDLKKLQEARDAAEREAAALRVQLADAKRQAGASDSAKAHADDIRRSLDVAKMELKGSNFERHRLEGEVARLKEALGPAERDAAALRLESADLKKTAGKRAAAEAELENLRRRYDEAREDRLRLHTDVKKLQDLRDAEERELAELRAKTAAGEDSARRLAQAAAELKTQQELRAASEKETASLRQQVALAEAKAVESNRYFASLEKELLEAQEGEAEITRLRGEVVRLESTCHEQQGFLDELGQTVMELEHRLQEAEAAKAAPASVTMPAPLPAPAPRIEVDSHPPPRPPPPAPAPELVLPESVLPSIPPLQTPSGSSSETTLRPAHLFGPNAADGQPAFVLHEMLPQDAMGVFYRASERLTNRAFAVRFIAGQAGEEQTQTIEREVEKLIALPHPNILHVQASGRRKNRLYLAMDLVQAPTLARAKIHDLRRVCAILRDVAGAVHYAHEEKIFHGDLNPDNIVVAPGEGGGDHPLVRDFELAFMLETLVAPGTPKEARPSLRNPAYLPPEQTKTLGVPADVYGLGATLYGALVGHAPFEGKDAAAIRRKVMFEEPPSLPKVRTDVPESLAAIVRRAMVKESGLRYPTAQAFADALGKFLDTVRPA